jgi:hypothetical protein
MATAIDVEEAIFGSQHIRNFLAHFTQTQWSRLTKATLLVGISRVDQLAKRSGTDLSRLTVQAIEDLAVHTHSPDKRRKGKATVSPKVGRAGYRVNKKSATKNYEVVANHGYVDDNGRACETTQSSPLQLNDTQALTQSIQSS